MNDNADWIPMHVYFITGWGRRIHPSHRFWNRSFLQGKNRAESSSVFYRRSSGRWWECMYLHQLLLVLTEFFSVFKLFPSVFWTVWGRRTGWGWRGGKFTQDVLLMTNGVFSILNNNVLCSIVLLLHIITVLCALGPRWRGWRWWRRRGGFES